MRAEVEQVDGFLEAGSEALRDSFGRLIVRMDVTDERLGPDDLVRIFP